MDFVRVTTCEPPLATLWELNSIYSYTHVQDLLEILDAKEELVELGRKDAEAKRLQAQNEQNKKPR